MGVGLITENSKVVAQGVVSFVSSVSTKKEVINQGLLSTSISFSVSSVLV